MSGRSPYLSLEILQSFNNKSILVDSSTYPLTLKLFEVHAYKCVIQTSPMVKSDEILSISDTSNKSVEMPVTKKKNKFKNL